MAKQTTEITRELLKQLRVDINAALAAVAKKHGVAISPGTATFSPSSATMKLLIAAGEGAKPGASAREVAASADWKLQAKSFNLQPKWLGKSFKYRGETCVVSGLMPTRRKFTVLVKDSKGGTFLMTADHLHTVMAR